MDQHYFRVPFAASGDILPIPEDAQGDGSVSYTEGFGFDYERNPATDPAAKRIPRDQTNELYRAVTEAIGQYQRFGFPEWITSADNDGSPYAYAKGSTVRYDDGSSVKVYGSLVDANTAVPGSDATKWREAEPFALATLVAQAADYVTPASNSLLVSPARLSTALREARMTAAAATRVSAAYSLALPGAVFAQGAFALVEFTVPDASPAGPLTLKVGALATLPLRTAVQAELAAGDLQANRVYVARSNGTEWLILNPLPSQLSPTFALPDRLAATTGATSNVADLNTALESGWYRAAAGVTNGPSGLSAVALFLAVEATDSNNVKQTARGVTGVSEADTRVYERTRIGGTWGPWYRIYSSATEIQQVALPPGMVGHTAGGSAPNGWLIRNGAAISRTTYAALFAVIGTTWGAGNGTTTFNLPNTLTNGYFDRAGTPDGVDYSDTVGPHTHSITPPACSSEGGSGVTVSGNTGGETIAAYSSGGVNSGGAVETAPVHQKYLPIIKY